MADLTKPREWWIELIPGKEPVLWGHYPDMAKHKGYIGTVVHVREVVE
jgi:hypothetical protein